MAAIVECVPNFSEGRDHDVITKISDAVRAVSGVALLSVEPDKDYNRTVVTFIGLPHAVADAAYQATKVAAAAIDMQKHAGEHPRIGATDVVPFVPVTGVSMADCVLLARHYGKRVGEELQIPVYLYEEAATRPERHNLATIRKSEYEGLPDKLKDPVWVPDFGPAVMNVRSGATVTGARFFLIAYNVNLNTNDPKVAQEIALRIRESGRLQKDAQGNPVLDASGQKVMVPGTLKSVKAMGVLLEAQNIAQVSINLVNYTVTPPHIAFEEVQRQAAAMGVAVTGSEIVGLTPLEALRMAGAFYAPGTTEERALVAAAVKHLGLSQLEQFDPSKKIIEYQLS